MKNATMLYKYPGSTEIHGDNFDFIIVDAEEGEVEQALADGWFMTTTEAKEAATIAAEAPATAKGTRKANVGNQTPSSPAWGGTDSEI